ncbi:MAG TPA: hypothetical protein VFP84_12220 [Kofleriaceae bacterium]|nr:hypothetical protein [Kofleriaceae bacterium]
MARLGELLVAAGVVTAEQVEQALRAQVMWGGRLGTNLVELHHLELDTLSKILGRQHGMPAALARHFEKADPDLQRMLSIDFAERFSCLPLLRMGPAQHVVVASIAPLTARQLAIVADELAVDVGRLVPAIAAELRIRYQLERVYNLRRAARFLRTRGKTIPPFPRFEVVPAAEAELDDTPGRTLPVSTREMAAFRLPDEPAPRAPSHTEVSTEIVIDLEPGLDPGLAPAPAPAPDSHERAAQALGYRPPVYHDGDLIPLDIITAHDATAAPVPVEDESSARQRRTYVRTLADAPAPPPASAPERPAALGRIALRKVATGAAPPLVATDLGADPEIGTLGEATRAIRRGPGRDRVAELVIDGLERFTAADAAILLVIRGATAIGWKGFVRASCALGEIAVPMDAGSLVPLAVERNATVRRPCGELCEIDRLLLASLGRTTGELVVVPIAIVDQVMCVIALAADAAPIPGAEAIAAAAGAAFARLMRDASR